MPVGVYALGVAAEEFVSEEVSRILADIGPSGAVVTSAPDSPASDGLAEMRILGVLAAGARARLHAADLRVPLWMWHYAWMHAAHCYSELATQRIEKKRGDEVMHLLPHEEMKLWWRRFRLSTTWQMCSRRRLRVRRSSG